MQVVNISEIAASLAGLWSPQVLADLNGQQIKLARFEGPFVWHHHDNGDEAFLVVSGSIAIETRDAVFELGSGDLLVVPRSVEHRPVAHEPSVVLLFEPAGTKRMGDGKGMG